MHCVVVMNLETGSIEHVYGPYMHEHTAQELVTSESQLNNKSYAVLPLENILRGVRCLKYPFA
jgi:hypothetical protein